MLIKKIKVLTCIVVAIGIISSVVCTQLLPKAASNYNYAEALQKSIMFYEFQRAGQLPSDKRDNWRGDSALNDGKDVGKDLTGGWFDAGDHVKFNLPMSYTSTMLSWSLYENPEAYSKSGQLKYMTDAIEWANDYLVKCHTGTNEYYYQIGNGDDDHKWWGPAEVMQMNRPSYKVTSAAPGSTVVAETAASLASAAIVLKNSNSTKAANYLKHAKELYTFAETTKSDAGYIEAANFYKSWSGFEDELSWAAIWLYLATNDSSYITKAEDHAKNWGKENQSDLIKYKWTHCWDDVHFGAQLLLSRITNKEEYKISTERYLDYWTTGYDGNKIKYSPKGLAWMDSWGSLRYATTTGFLADVYASWTGCSSSKVSTYQNFAKSQADYALGSSGRSYLIGFGTNSPKSPHHRTAHSSWSDQMTNPDYHRHVLVGALVGGPDAADSYKDLVSDYTANEVACDYNAGFTGLVARLYSKYGGTPISNLTAIESVTNDEFFVEAAINGKGPNYTEVKAKINNRTGWPARMGDKLSFKYYFDISEFIKEGKSISDVTLSTNYNDGATIKGPFEADSSKNLYYILVDFTGTKIYPGGQSAYKKEVQFRIAGPQGTTFFDPTNDFSYTEIASSTSQDLVKCSNMPVYDNGKLVFGKEIGKNTTTNPTTSQPTIPPTTSTAKKGDVNNDGKINSTDVSLIERHVLGAIDLTSEQLTRADVNYDNKWNTTDVSIATRYVLGSIDSL